MMHSSTIAGSIPARRDRFADDHGAQLRRLEILQRAEKFAGRKANGADDDGLTHMDQVYTSGRTEAASLRSEEGRARTAASLRSAKAGASRRRAGLAPLAAEGGRYGWFVARADEGCRTS